MITAEEILSSFHVIMNAEIAGSMMMNWRILKMN